jgi:hypothetical protein
MEKLKDGYYYGCTMTGEVTHIVMKAFNISLCGLKRNYFLRKAEEDGVCKMCQRVYKTAKEF